MKRFALTFVLLIAAALVAAAACNKKSAESSGGAATPATSAPGGGGLKVEDVKIGDGAVAAPGKTVSVHYTGRLTDGTKFDSSYDRNQTFTFRIGTGQVIQGWNQGVPGMRVGGKRHLTIPSALGYGTTGTATIPANAALYFLIELVSIQGK